MHQGPRTWRSTSCSPWSFDFPYQETGCGALDSRTGRPSSEGPAAACDDTNTNTAAGHASPAARPRWRKSEAVWLPTKPVAPVMNAVFNQPPVADLRQVDRLGAVSGAGLCRKRPLLQRVAGRRAQMLRHDLPQELSEATVTTE